MGCSLRAGHCMCAPYMHLCACYSCQTVSLPYALMSTGKNQSPPTEIQQKIPHEVPRTFYLSKTDTCCHACSTPGKIQCYNWLGGTHSDSDEKHTPLHIRIHKQWNLYLLFPYASYSHKYHYLLVHKKYEKKVWQYKIHCSSQHHFITSVTQNSWSWSTPFPQMIISNDKNIA